MTNKSSERAPKILVLGATGESGSRILRYLRQLVPDAVLGGAARHPAALPAGADFVKIDLSEQKSAEEIFSRYDVVVCAAGPMDRLGTHPHMIALNSGVNLVDINDIGKVTSEILKLHDNAANRGVTFLSGMGLSPGITSIMLRKLALAGASRDGVYRSRMYMGSRYGGGKTSPYAMLANFSKKMDVFRNGRVQTVKTPWEPKSNSFLFPGHLTPIGTIPYSSPEVSALGSERYDQKAARVTAFDTRFAIQGFTPAMAKFIAFINTGGRQTEKLAGKFYESGQKMKGTAKSDPDTIVSVYPDSDPEKGLVLMGDVSSYDLTAAMAACAAEALVRGGIGEDHGVYTADLLSCSSIELLERSLSSLGFVIKPAQTDFRAADDWFGWLESDFSDTSRLRHYGENWYTALGHPRMPKVQTQYLWDSLVWKTLRGKMGRFRLSVFVMKMMTRWKKHRKIIDRKFGIPGNAVRAKIVKDLSMFTSGYSLFRETAGLQRAFAEYREMFLRTGGMEMHWLWPRPEIFARMKNPQKSVVDYYRAFLDSYVSEGVLQYSEKNDEAAGRTTFIITDCLYADIFGEMGVPELENLVREQEKQELIRVASQSGLRVDFEIGHHGHAVIALTAGSHPAEQRAA